jgi:DNA polymerase-1
MILDGNSIVNRAFYGIRMLNAPDGTPTNGIYGFLSILQRLIAEEKPDSLCVAFDLAAPTFRHKQYDGYKAQRKGMPDELAQQMPILKQVLDAMGIVRLEMEGYEADDIIGTVSRICMRNNYDCVIVTGDKDSFQLIDERVTVKHIKTRAGQTETTDYTPARFTEEYGFAPPRMVDLKALMGDSSDNIPGVPGVGEKTAMDLLHRFGSLDGVYENIDSPDIKAGARKKLAEGEPSARLSYELATIKTDVPLDFTPESAAFENSYGEEVYDLFTRLGFSRFIERWGITRGANTAAEESSAEHLPRERVEGGMRIIARVAAAETVYIYAPNGCGDLELSFGDTVYEVTSPKKSLIRTIFASGKKVVTHNAKDLMRCLLENGLPTESIVFDAALAAYLIEPTLGKYELKDISMRYFGCEYSGAEALVRLKPELEKQLGEMNMLSLLTDVEVPLCRVLAEMEHTGVLVDKAALQSYGQSLGEEIAALESEIYVLAGEEFNINSTRQLGYVLFEKLMLPSGKKTKTGWSTNAEVLEKLRGKHPIIEKILDYRVLTKLKSTYADGLLRVISEDGRVHTRFQMTATATGRLSSAEPNLQNIPVRRERGKQLRCMFVAPVGRVLVDADYSQIELRVLAHVSGDETMRRAFREGEDVHAVTASQVFGVPLEEVTPTQRSHAKAVNFGIVYGISAFSLAQDIKVSQPEAKAYINAYLEKYHGVRDYMKAVVEKAKEDGYVETLLHRRRPLPELKSSNFVQRSFGERVALNMPIQGTAADIIKIAMVNVHARLARECPGAKLILQVHDELIVECDERDSEKVCGILTEEMENAVEFSVPLTAEAHSGRSWNDAK